MSDTPVRTFDARPDEADFRDRLYQPSLINVPPIVPIGTYLRRDVPVLNQGREGACTGFGLATVAHYLLRSRAGRNDKTLVSPRMLYNLAQTYDRWAGEDYEGSSCRGAMKAWHKHGVCSEDLWGYHEDQNTRVLTAEREADAALRPLGAYYRVNSHSLNDMHAALAEVGILYVSCTTHSGWNRVGTDGLIDFEDDKAGGHAFAIVGYDENGFWFQNSWGERWGYRGCGHISYADWLENGKDVWVCRLGVPVSL